MRPIATSDECGQCGMSLATFPNVIATDIGDYCSVVCAETHAEQTEDAMREQDAPVRRHGGARKNAGRKPTGKPARVHVVGVRLTEAELETLTKHADAAGEDLATWIRGVALAVRGAR